MAPLTVTEEAVVVAAIDFLTICCAGRAPMPFDAPAAGARANDAATIAATATAEAVLGVITPGIYLPGAGHTGSPTRGACDWAVLRHAEHPGRILPQELRPDLVLERNARELALDPLQRQAHREVAGVDHLVRSPGVGVVDHVLGVVLRGEGGGRVVEVRPLQHQLDRQVGPRLAPVAGHKDE